VLTRRHVLAEQPGAQDGAAFVIMIEQGHQVGADGFAKGRVIARQTPQLFATPNAHGLFALLLELLAQQRLEQERQSLERDLVFAARRWRDLAGHGAVDEQRLVERALLRAQYDVGHGIAELPSELAHAIEEVRLAGAKTRLHDPKRRAPGRQQPIQILAPQDAKIGLVTGVDRAEAAVGRLAAAAEALEDPHRLRPGEFERFAHFASSTNRRLR
jgi:hypothetical protein